MKAIEVTVIRENPDHNSRTVRATVLSDTTPNPLPVNGVGVEGMADSDTFAPFSILYVVGDANTKVYIANESGQFVAQ